VQLARARDYHLSVLGQRGRSPFTIRLYGGVETRFVDFLRRELAIEQPRPASARA
jgi:hypothetical protein